MLRQARTMAMAKHVRTIIRAVLGFAEGHGWVERNVALSSTEELNASSVTTAMRLPVILPVRPGGTDENALKRC